MVDAGPWGRKNWRFADFFGVLGWPPSHFYVRKNTSVTMHAVEKAA